MQRILKDIFRTRLQGSSLVEILVSLCIIVFFSALASSVYVNIQKSSLSFFKIKAVELAESKMNEVLKTVQPGEEKSKLGEFVIRKTTIQNSRFPDCHIVRIIVFDCRQKKIQELESTVLINQ